MATTIQAAEATYHSEKERLDALLSRRELRNALIGCTCFAVAVGFLVLGFVFLKSAAVLSSVCFALFFLTVLPGAVIVESSRLTENRTQAQLKSARKQVEEAQHAFVEEYGVSLPKGGLAALAFPEKLPEEPQFHGTADAVLAESNELVTLVLWSSPGEGYNLFTTDGRRLRPLTSPASLA